MILRDYWFYTWESGSALRTIWDFGMKLWAQHMECQSPTHCAISPLPTALILGIDPQHTSLQFLIVWLVWEPCRVVLRAYSGITPIAAQALNPVNIFNSITEILLNLTLVFVSCASGIPDLLHVLFFSLH